ncbi:MAG: hypothetical protein A2Y33_15230 [Spirochaetes bacterium GWF1_51_8]|nr:MAG: hypothetical protein A2Y33_15230 [Spirochaetes bacterium GWF1_51_8]
MFLRIFISFTVLFSTAAHAFAYLTIDVDSLTNMQSVTNTPFFVTEEPEIPKSYVKTGKIEFSPEESIIRRFDIIFFVSIPITFYLTLNILQIANFNLKGSYGLDVVDWNYIYLNTLLIPLYVAFQDMLYIHAAKVEKYGDSSHPELQFGFNLIRASF